MKKRDIQLNVLKSFKGFYMRIFLQNQKDPHGFIFQKKNYEAY